MPTSRLDALRTVDPVLSTVVQGYSNAAMVGDKLFPRVSVSKLKGKIPVFGRDAFIVRATERAPRAQSNRIQPLDLQLVEFETIERDVEMALDYLDEEEALDIYGYEQKIAKELADILLLGKEKEIADIVQNPDNYDSELKLEIESEEAFNDYTNDADPIQIIREAMSAVRGRIAHYPNTMIIGDSVYQHLALHPKVLERIKFSGLGVLTKNTLSEMTDIPDIHIGMSVYSADGVSFADVWGGNIVLAYVDKSPRESRTEFNPSYGYTFQRDGKPEIDYYTENGGKIKVIRNTDNYCVKVTSQDAAFLIYNAIHEL